MIKDSALVVVDMLYDFIDGSLACQNAVNAVKNTVAFLNGAVENSPGDENEIIGGFPVLFVRDCHPADHCSFKKNGGVWPDHCIAGTHGSDIHIDLAGFAVEDLIFNKGCDPSAEQYSGFDAKNDAEQSLGEILELLDAKDVYVCGIATEYCVRKTCEDLQQAGFHVHLLQDCIGYVNRKDSLEVLQEMKGEGISIE